MRCRETFYALLTAGLVASFSAFESRAEEPLPSVVAAWPAGLFEARVAFSGPVPNRLLDDFVGRSLTFSAVARRDEDRRSDLSEGKIAIAAAKLADDGRTLILATDPHPRAGTYAFNLSPRDKNRIDRGKPLFAYDLSGVEVVIDDTDSVVGENRRVLWTGWWPVLDPIEARKRLAGSVDHEKGFALLTRKGKLSLTTQVTLPKGPVVLEISAGVPLEATLGGENPGGDDADARAKQGKATFRVESTGEPILLTIAIPLGGHYSAVTAEFKGDYEAAFRKLDRHALTLPWVPPSPPPAPPLDNVPDLKGGDPKLGARVFAGNEAKCANCHKVRGVGGEVGPDLSGLIGRDRVEVYRDIFNPSARIHPDYVSYTIALKDGRVLVGTVRAQGAEALRVNDTEAKTTVVPRAEIEDIRPSATSIMPVGLVGAIGEANLRDLIAFLTTGSPGGK